MVLLETDIENSEKTVEAWLSEIEARWQTIPEFQVDPEKLRHLAIICDGNRRAAQERGLNPYLGHRAGVEAIKGIVRACREWDIRTLTFWIWSTENWAREEKQVRFVMELAKKFLSEESFFEELQQNEVKFTHLGRKDRLPTPILKILEDLERQTANFGRYHLNLAMDYGGLDEMTRGVQKMFEDFIQGRFNPEIFKTAPQAILGFLDTANQVLPDLVIRTGVKKGEIPHTSGFMPLQTAYSGWIFLPDLFPNLTPQTLLKPIQEFLEYERRFGR
jgi:undecaprenyl diphosphate synthase